MSQRGGTERRRGAVALAELVGKALDPVTARRGFSVVEVSTCWGEIVGARYADCSRPERIIWPRGTANEGKSGTLVVRIEGPRALFMQHEAEQIVQRVNGFIGHGAIGKMRIVQGPVASPTANEAPPVAPIEPQDQSALEEILMPVDCDDLRAALTRLGQAVLAERDK